LVVTLLSIVNSDASDIGFGGYIGVGCSVFDGGLVIVVGGGLDVVCRGRC
jgi:hypothetical protein